MVAIISLSLYYLFICKKMEEGDKLYLQSLLHWEEERGTSGGCSHYFISLSAKRGKRGTSCDCGH